MWNIKCFNKDTKIKDNKPYNEVSEIISKIENDLDSVTIDELKKLVLTIEELYLGDPVLYTLSKEELIRNTNYLLRSFYGIVETLHSWKGIDKNYVLSKLNASSYGIEQESRRYLFKKHSLSIADEIGFFNRMGFCTFKFFSYQESLFLLLTYVHGRSITNSIEAILEEIQSSYLNDMCFNIFQDNIKIYYKDTYDNFNKVSVDKNFKNPQWDDLTESEIQWFDEMWESVGNTKEEEESIFIPADHPYFAYKIYKDIILKSKNELFIIDPYIDDQLFNALEQLNIGIKIRILTDKAQGDSITLAKRFAQERGNFELRKTKVFHDRYIFRDDSCFIIGGSLNSLGTKSSMITPLKDKYVADELRSYADSVWASGSPLE
jgi:hypothetical protein